MLVRIDYLFLEKILFLNPTPAVDTQQGVIL